ncbi:hypothetical protein [Brevibacillus reuszeri]|uniref:hypothetical protein n=1 Tax=Brevibacillus reuszeri TaxID=54915 RepID=UPI0013E037F5|nr:hypothetical protein [Brevibacillus reuszeri]
MKNWTSEEIGELLLYFLSFVMMVFKLRVVALFVWCFIFYSDLERFFDTPHA